MSEYVQDVDINIKAFVDNDFEIDDDGRCYIVNLIYIEEEDPVEARVDLDGVIENLIEHNNDLHGYQDLFSVAHELSRQAERLREVAGRFEDGGLGESHLQYVSSLYADGVFSSRLEDPEDL